MTGVEKFKRKAGCDFARLMHMQRREKLHKRSHVGFVVERLEEILAVAAALFVDVIKVALLEKARVAQEHFTELGRSVACENAPAEALPHKLWKVAGMIDMRVRQNDEIYRLRVNGKIAVLFERRLSAALVKTAVEKDAFAIGFDEMHRACCCMRCAEKRDFHATILSRSSLMFNISQAPSRPLRPAFPP